VIGLGQPSAPIEPRPAVRARGLVHRFHSGQQGLAGVDLDVAEGEIIALAGPNSRQTTLLRSSPDSCGRPRAASRSHLR
jgi:ABC-type phosphate/phosphonate transport system ATPase subunit